MGDSSTNENRFPPGFFDKHPLFGQLEKVAQKYDKLYAKSDLIKQYFSDIGEQIKAGSVDDLKEFNTMLDNINTDKIKNLPDLIIQSTGGDIKDLVVSELVPEKEPSLTDIKNKYSVNVDKNLKMQASNFITTLKQSMNEYKVLFLDLLEIDEVNELKELLKMYATEFLEMTTQIKNNDYLRIMRGKVICFNRIIENFESCLIIFEEERQNLKNDMFKIFRSMEKEALHNDSVIQKKLTSLSDLIDNLEDSLSIIDDLHFGKLHEVPKLTSEFKNNLETINSLNDIKNMDTSFIRDVMNTISRANSSNYLLYIAEVMRDNLIDLLKYKKSTKEEDHIKKLIQDFSSYSRNHNLAESDGLLDFFDISLIEFREFISTYNNSMITQAHYAEYKSITSLGGRSSFRKGESQAKKDCIIFGHALLLVDIVNYLSEKDNEVLSPHEFLLDFLKDKKNDIEKVKSSIEGLLNRVRDLFSIIKEAHSKFNRVKTNLTFDLAKVDNIDLNILNAKAINLIFIKLVEEGEDILLNDDYFKPTLQELKLDEIISKSEDVIDIINNNINIIQEQIEDIINENTEIIETLRKEIKKIDLGFDLDLIKLKEIQPPDRNKIKKILNNLNVKK